MNVARVIERTRSFMQEVLHKSGSVVGASQDEGGWKVEMEVAEEVEYMRKRARDDLMGIYEIYLNNNMEVIEFKRTKIRERGASYA